MKVTVLDKKCFYDLQVCCLADPKSGPCGVFEVGDGFEFWRDGGRDDFWHFGVSAGPDGRAFPCAEAWLEQAERTGYFRCGSRGAYTGSDAFAQDRADQYRPTDLL